MEKVFIRTEQFREVCQYLYKLGYSWDESNSENILSENRIMANCCNNEYMGIFLGSTNMHLTYTTIYEYFRKREATEITISDIVLRATSIKEGNIIEVDNENVVVMKVLDNTTFIVVTKDAYLGKVFWDAENNKWAHDNYIDIYAAIRELQKFETK